MDQAFFRVLSSITSNISAAWFGLAFITPNFFHVSFFELVLLLTKDIFFGIVFMLFAVIIERLLKYEQP